LTVSLRPALRNSADDATVVAFWIVLRTSVSCESRQSTRRDEQFQEARW
jgi:hypothetical protein